MEGFMHWNIPGVNMASSDMVKLRNPSDAEYNDMVSSNMISQLPVTPDDVYTTNKIFNCNIPYPKGENFRRQPPSGV